MQPSMVMSPVTTDSLVARLAPMSMSMPMPMPTETAGSTLTPTGESLASPVMTTWNESSTVTRKMKVIGSVLWFDLGTLLTIALEGRRDPTSHLGATPGDERAVVGEWPDEPPADTSATRGHRCATACDEPVACGARSTTVPSTRRGGLVLGHEKPSEAHEPGLPGPRVGEYGLGEWRSSRDRARDRDRPVWPKLRAAATAGTSHWPRPKNSRSNGEPTWGDRDRWRASGNPTPHARFGVASPDDAT